MIWMENPINGAQTVAGPATGFLIRGSSLFASTSRNEIARFQRGCWCRRKSRGHFSLLWTDVLTSLSFQDQATGDSLELGHFEMVGVVCDTIHVDRENSREVARFDESSGQWRATADGRFWPEIVIRSALAAPVPSKDIVPAAAGASRSQPPAFAMPL